MATAVRTINNRSSDTMTSIREGTCDTAAEYTCDPGDYRASAAISGFLEVADAMLT